MIDEHQFSDLQMSYWLYVNHYGKSYPIEVGEALPLYVIGGRVRSWLELRKPMPRMRSYSKYTDGAS